MMTQSVFDAYFNEHFSTYFHRRNLVREAFRLVCQHFRSNRVRFLFIVLGMMVGTASIILVVTIGITGKQYVVRQIESIGTNMIDAEYQSGGDDTNPDRLTIADIDEVRQQVTGVVAASPVLQMDSRIPVENGKERDVRLLGVYSDYSRVRNLVVLAGRFFDGNDEAARSKVGVLQRELAEKLYGSAANAVGKTIVLNSLPFAVIGTFEERVDTFGQSEVTENCILIPYSVSRFFSDTPDVEQIYFSASDASMVGPVTKEIGKVIRSRNRPDSNYIVQNLTVLIELAKRTGNAMTLLLLVIAAITLLVSGIGIMNIMLATVNSRVYEIGIRKAVGATNADIRFQFLSETVLITLVGGFAGVLIGLALPFSIRILTNYRVPISGLSVIVAVAVAAAVGVSFGTLPAVRAARLDPITSLRHEG